MYNALHNSRTIETSIKNVDNMASKSDPEILKAFHLFYTYQRVICVLNRIVIDSTVQFKIKIIFQFVVVIDEQ